MHVYLGLTGIHTKGILCIFGIFFTACPQVTSHVPNLGERSGDVTV